ncbi:MAG: hypothetical protein KF797_02370 [Flavobacteriales bacterium]|nr:hypothetical protein [Flavobacteriales bacterium]
MRKTILTLAAAVFACTATFAQEKAKDLTKPQPAAVAGDELTQQKRELSKELKDAVRKNESMIQHATQLAAGATGAEQEGHTAKLEALRGVQSQLTDQLNLVNQATPENSKTVFATAREVLAKVNKSFAEYKGGADVKEPAEK